MAPQTRAGSGTAGTATRPYLSRAAKDEPQPPTTNALAPQKATRVVKRTKKATKITTTKREKIMATKATKKGRTTTVVKEEHSEESPDPTTKEAIAQTTAPSPPLSISRSKDHRYFCGFCMEPMPRSDFPPSDVYPAQCRACAAGSTLRDHDGVFTELICWDCCHEHFKIRAADGLAWGLACPVCFKSWPLENVATFLSPQELLLAENRITNRTLERDPTFRWCAQDTCTSGQFYDMEQVGKDPQVCCGHCEKLNCFKCRIPFHEGFTCEGYAEENEKYADVAELARDQTDASIKAMRRNATRRCPQCMTAVEKTDGCDHIVCKYGYLDADLIQSSSKLTDSIPGLTCSRVFTWSDAHMV